MSAGFVASFGGAVYLCAGVVRDVPELDIYKGSAYRGMHAEYVDVPYSWNKDFVTDKIHILVIGDSMARDWCNILNESDRAEEFEISYVYSTEFGEAYRDRLGKADFVFWAGLGDSTELGGTCLDMLLSSKNFYVVGNKNFGESNGAIYYRRFRDDYLQSSIVMGKTSFQSDMTYEQQNEKQKLYWGQRYIDLIDCVRNTDGTIPVFTDTGKFISSDTEHLTKNGCIYYAELLDLSFIHK